MKNSKKGLTIVELMVVVAIIGVLASIVLASIAASRESAREKKRIADMANIEFAMTLYAEQTRDYPDAPEGIVLGHGGELDSLIVQFGGTGIQDPSSGGADDSYNYIYFSDFTCSSPGQMVLIVQNMESTKNANFAEVCTDGMADVETYANSYVKILGGSFAGGIAYTQSVYTPYAQGQYYTQNTYYTQSGYYSQSGYYGQSGYYSQGGYSGK